MEQRKTRMTLRGERFSQYHLFNDAKFENISDTPVSRHAPRRQIFLNLYFRATRRCVASRATVCLIFEINTNNRLSWGCLPTKEVSWHSVSTFRNKNVDIYSGLCLSFLCGATFGGDSTWECGWIDGVWLIYTLYWHFLVKFTCATDPWPMRICLNAQKEMWRRQLFAERGKSEQTQKWNSLRNLNANFAIFRKDSQKQDKTLLLFSQA